ncbi:cobamide remodeling phosphodiesterase CbiR [Desulfonatronospira sp.]|uniref:cobamide remodeling phosphodiesterase CbiR n=1 Tax=Desulfonatronospira sp. TaxID=1962951 RepID=UPI0025C247BD|nr:cobamide remodeling phosphodiesterase CbiR [Desulfonatronospira sp.]
MILKSNSTWRLGTTSYIIPDHILPNLYYLQDKVDDVELILFESAEQSSIPDASQVRRMQSVAADSGLSYTVHLPLDLSPGSRNENQRRHCVDTWKYITELMQPLNPVGWVVHLSDPPGDINHLSDWHEQCRKSLEELSREIDPALICIENLDYDQELIWPWVLEMGFSLCMDLGHLQVRGEDLSACLDKWLGHTRIIHLHALNSEGQDHVGLQHMDQDLLARLLHIFDTRSPSPLVVPLEIFSSKHFQGSLEAIKKARQ